MYITMNSDYALRAMMRLAEEGNGIIIPIAQISKSAEIPEAFLRKIVPRLQKAGLIRTSRGNQGGISLARPAHSISVLDILIPVEESLSMHRCVLDDSDCHRKNFCAMQTVWQDINDEVRHLLADRTLQQLVS